MKRLLPRFSMKNPRPDSLAFHHQPVCGTTSAARRPSTSMAPEALTEQAPAPTRLVTVTSTMPAGAPEASALAVSCVELTYVEAMRTPFRYTSLPGVKPVPLIVPVIVPLGLMTFGVTEVTVSGAAMVLKRATRFGVSATASDGVSEVPESEPSQPRNTQPEAA